MYRDPSDLIKDQYQDIYKDKDKDKNRCKDKNKDKGKNKDKDRTLTMTRTRTRTRTLILFASQVCFCHFEERFAKLVKQTVLL